MMPILGAHMSIAGGYYKAVEAAAELGMSTVQVFTKNNNQWHGKPLSDSDAEQFRRALDENGIRDPLSHSSYLINLASPDAALRKKSIDAVVVELQRAGRLGIPLVVLHPGSYTTSTEKQGLRHIVQSLDAVHGRIPADGSRILLETTAGQGSNLGWQFEHLATVLAEVKDPDRLGICFDTCHVFAAGYPMSGRKDYLDTMRRFDQVIGLDKIRAFHLNDSKCEFGSRKDRHEHIGLGCLGAAAFEHLLKDRRFRKTPMYLETPKGDHPDSGRSWDEVNLNVLRELAGGGGNS
jgi:deoxyribonuclease IV